jgi:hypothetical protein
MIDNSLKYADENDEEIKKEITETQLIFIKHTLQYCEKNWLKFDNSGNLKKLRNLSLHVREIRNNMDTSFIMADEKLLQKASDCYTAQYWFLKTSYDYDNIVWNQIFLKGIPEDRIAEVKTAAKKVANGGCYIATAVYGSYDCPEVWVLRRYRDYSLARTWYGRTFIKCYYFISPKIVRHFGKAKLFNTFWKKVLDQKVKQLKSKGYGETPFKDKKWQ